MVCSVGLQRCTNVVKQLLAIAASSSSDAVEKAAGELNDDGERDKEKIAQAPDLTHKLVRRLC